MINVVMNFASETAEVEKEGIAALGVDGKAFIIQFITWILVFLVLRKFVFKPVVNALEKRRLTIEKGVELSSEMVAEKEKLDKEVQKTMAKARSDANDIIAKTNQQATAIIKDAETEAKAKVDAMVKEAKAKINDETMKAKRALEKDIVKLVVEATEIVADEKIDAQKDASLIARALKGEA